MLCAPAVLLAACEGLLRVAGVEPDAPGVEVTRARDGRMRVRVPAPASAVDGELTCAERKAPGAFRIAFLGASTTAGVPYHPACSFADFVVVRLRALFPERAIEGVVLGMPTLPARSVRAAAAVDLDADVVVLEAGHNEFLPNNLPAAPALLGVRRALEDWRLFRLLSRPLAGCRRDRAPAPSREAALLLDPSAVAFADGVRARCAADVADALARVRSRGALAVLLVPPANWADFPPEGSVLPEPLDAGARAAVQAAILAADRAADGGDLAAALAAADALESLVPGAAPGLHARGRACLRAGREADAAAWFARAADADPLPISISPRLQRRLCELAAEQGALVADAAARFERRGGPVLGLPLLSDHCHPSLAGQYEFASTVLEALAGSGRLAPAAEWDLARDLGFDEAYRRIGADPRLPGAATAFAGLADLRAALASRRGAEYARRAAERLRLGGDGAPDPAAARAALGVAELLAGERAAGARTLAEVRAAGAPSALALLELLSADSSRVRDALAGAGIPPR